MPEDMKKIKILYLITKSNWGGAQRYVYDLATNLPKDEFEAYVAFGGNGTLKDQLELKKIPTFTIENLDRDVSALKELRALINLYKLIHELEPEVVHTNSSKAGGLGAVAVLLINIFRKLKNKKLTKTVFTAHGWAFKEKRKFTYRKLIEYSSWLTIKLSDQTITVSEDDSEKIKDFMFIKNKIVTIHNGIGPIEFIERNEARKILSEKMAQNIDENTMVLGTIAELHKNKGVDYAISAVKTLMQSGKLNKIIYIVIGSGEELKSLNTAIKRENLETAVYLIGQYPNACSLLKGLDIFILPSLKEGLPYVVLEAGLAGLPIIATNVGGIPEIIDDMKSGILIHEKRPKEISDAAIFIYEHENKRREFSNKIYESVSTNFTLESMVMKTVSVYRKINN